MEHEFRALLTGSASISALLSASQINWIKHPQGRPYPAIVLSVVGNADGLTQQGPDGLWRGRVQVDCYARDYLGAVQLKDAVVGVLSGYRGGGFQLISLDSQRDGDETGGVDDLARFSLDFLTNWSEANG
ncbi:tail completion protein gp17 [Celeribacter sp.]|uniref:tail completion protein gp17 n=1 Tax=Celeribacter sp. TaxID=1890673 RepID=UPI003A8CF068